MAINHEFREHYRQQMSPRYSPVAHVASVFTIGLVFIAVCLFQLENVQAIEWLAVLAGVVIFNIGEYMTHKHFGHKERSFARMFFERHFVQHHGFFSNQALAIESPRDLRLVLFPVWLIFAITFVFLVPMAYLLSLFASDNAAWLFLATGIDMYLLYEFMHLCFHLPNENQLTKIPGIAFMKKYHSAHHNPENMDTANFNLTIPLTDILLGTYKGADTAKSNTAMSAED